MNMYITNIVFYYYCIGILDLLQKLWGNLRSSVPKLDKCAVYSVMWKNLNFVRFKH